jgi:hypothetical protein
MPDLSSWLTKAAACAALGVKERTLERLAKDGKIQKQDLPADGRRPIPVYNPEDIEKILADKKTMVLVPSVDSASVGKAGGEMDKLLALATVIQAARPQTLPLWLSLRQASIYSGLSMSCIARLCRVGGIPGVFRDRGWRIPRVGLDWVAGIAPTAPRAMTQLSETQSILESKRASGVERTIA